jgi:hypothetical protein
MAVTMARGAVGTGTYQLGTGDMDMTSGGPSDCFGFAYCWCYGVRRHRPGFNRGTWSSVEDDLNSNSSIEDADHAKELFERVFTPAPGCLLVYPTIRIRASDGGMLTFIGHAAIVVSADRTVEWDHSHPTWSLLDIVQCRGPNGRRPAIAATDGAVFDHHDAQWPKPEHRTVLLRPLP